MMMKLKSRKILFLFLIAGLALGSSNLAMGMDANWLTKMITLVISQQIGAVILYLACFGPTNQFK